MVVLCPTLARAADDHPEPGYAKNAVFAEGFGSGIAYSVNYDRLLLPILSLRGGAGVYSVSGAAFVSVPLIVNFLVPLQESHRLELGVGATLGIAPGQTGITGPFDVENGFGIAAAGVVGYRYVPRGSGWTFRVSFTPLVGERLWPWGGASLGYAF